MKVAFFYSRTLHIRISAYGTDRWQHSWEQWKWMKSYRIWEANRLLSEWY